MSSEDDSFIADGPAEFAFRCNGANIGVGGVMSGWWIGLYAQGLDFGIQIPEQFLFGRAGVIGDVKNGGGVVGLSDNLYGVYGQVGDTDLGGTPAGVCGVSQSNAGVSGRSSEWVGVFGQADTNIGVFGMSRDSWGVSALSGTAASQPMEHAALLATSSQRTAVAAASDTAVAVHAHSGPAHNFGTFKTGTVTATSSGNGYGVSALSLKFDAVHGASVQSHGVTGYSY